MNYNHLRNRGFEDSATGPVVRKANVIVGLTANKREYKIEENSPVERHHLVGLWVTKEATQIDEKGNTQADGVIFQSAYISLFVKQAKTLHKIYLEQIRLANAQGRPYYISLPGVVNLSESEIHVPKNDTIQANTVLEIQFDYIQFAPK